jgi:type II secretory pathway component PulF
MVIVSLMVALFRPCDICNPQVCPLFKSAKIDLPLPTRIMILINDIVQQYGVYLIAGVIILIVGFVF